MTGTKGEASWREVLEFVALVLLLVLMFGALIVLAFTTRPAP